MALTHDEAVARARELAPGIAARAREAEELRAPHPDSIRELVEADLIGILTPKRWGGSELGLDTHREIVEIISAACVSTGWILAFYTGHSGMFATRFPEQAQAEFFAERPYIMAPATMAPVAKAERSDGGWTVSGRMPWGTGVMHADWVILSGFASDGAPYMFAMPAEDTKVDDVWQMAGMAATGSNDIIVDNVFVPDHRSVPLRVAGAANCENAQALDDPMYHLPLLAFIYCQAIPVFSGALRGAVNSFDEITRRRTRTYTGATSTDDKYAHILLGQARIEAHMAERLVLDLIRETETHEGKFTIEDRARMKGSAAAIVELCRTSVNNLMHNAGASSFNLDVPLQRVFRDVNVIATHAFWDWGVSREQVGRISLGLPPTSPLV
ncbi:acyl-CoA dehydrogenase family protein [Gordonia sp. CPCC 205515]|uniref:acyl-CoA dehydrogenase family protein n=1 Tax=Gordonia sp. CPCC 205515 TaxID=3140791 RepID=UPI003AF381EA